MICSQLEFLGHFFDERRVGRERALSQLVGLDLFDNRLHRAPLTSASTRRPRRISLADNSRWSCARRSTCCW
jgi:hypothetical protein